LALIDYDVHLIRAPIRGDASEKRRPRLPESSPVQPHGRIAVDFIKGVVYALKSRIAGGCNRALLEKQA
jgi:hypothetical protein